MAAVVRSALEGVKVFALCVVAAVFYGIVHDLITTRISLEYFTVGHPPVWDGTDDPTLLALTWGVIATWWAGAIIGIPLALATQVGSLPKRRARSMIKPIGVLLACMAMTAAAAGIVAFAWCNDPLTGWFDNRLPMSGIGPPESIGFFVDSWIHLASYGAGFIGGIVLIIWVLVRRWQAEVRRRLGKAGLQGGGLNL